MYSVLKNEAISTNLQYFGLAILVRNQYIETKQLYAGAYLVTKVINMLNTVKNM